MSRLTTIHGIGPASERAFRAAGIRTAEALRDLGADAAYARLLATGSRPHFIGYYALVMALQGRRWNDCRGEEKAALRVRFDAIVSESRGGAGAALAAFMDEIGLRPATFRR